MKQHEAVIEVMRANGGYATLGTLYEKTLKVPGVDWKTKTPFESIRRIVQTRAEFVRIRPGVWGLKEYQARIPNELREIESPKSHTFVQGQLVEIGNMLEMDTYVPPQDKNRLFEGKRLEEIVTVKPLIPQFGYPELVKLASTVDVIWFNKRNMPEAMFEVEHTTDIDRSLLKFFRLQDFDIEFHIVANPAREKLFSEKISAPPFEQIQSRVKFVDYDAIEDWYNPAFVKNRDRQIRG